jgi:hypothetical protein
MKRVSVTRVTAFLEHSAANVGDISWFGCGVGRVVFYVSGADPYHGDRLGRLTLTIEGLRQRDALVFAECRARGLPVVVTMAGGYAMDVEDIVTIHANTIREAVLSIGIDPPSPRSPGMGLRRAGRRAAGPHVLA